ncbi:hypothetical protein HDE_05732 [Halotydeus destructor]|nr:hypothetical protein HDE_05732 [Halotydeus destructor]
MKYLLPLLFLAINMATVHSGPIKISGPSRDAPVEDGVTEAERDEATESNENDDVSVERFDRETDEEDSNEFPADDAYWPKEQTGDEEGGTSGGLDDRRRRGGKHSHRQPQPTASTTQQSDIVDDWDEWLANGGEHVV